MADYTSKYFSTEEMDQRMLQGTYDDAVKKGFSGTKDEFDNLLANLASYPTIEEVTDVTTIL